MTNIQPSGPLRLGSFLPASKILLLPNMDCKKEVLHRLVVTAWPEISAQEAADLALQIEKREETISTALRTGIAFPHIRVEGIKELKAALALFPKPFPFSGGKKVRALLLFLSPADPAFFRQHLQFLSIGAQTFTADFVRKLSACSQATQASSLFK